MFRRDILLRDNVEFRNAETWVLRLEIFEMFDRVFHFPTNPFTILEPRDQEIGEFYLVQERRATDFEAPKLGKGSSGRLSNLKRLH